MKFLFTACLLLFTTLAFSQSTTTSSIKGIVKDIYTNEELIGASIFAVHLPTATTYGTASDVKGAFLINNMRVGGPYRITISYTGYSNVVHENIFLRLGEAQNFVFELNSAIAQLKTVEVLARQGSVGENAGTSTQISAQQIDILPTLDRNLNDFMRLTPQASIRAGGGISFAGMNNRFNALYIDGAVNNDVFGLSETGTNGGQAGISPFSLDIIDQVQVVLSPYDVSLGGFAGGGINAVTKTGSNEWEGSAYYFLQNENMVGETNGILANRLAEMDPNFEASPLEPFTSKTYGASIGGPIKKDKIFFFVNAELQRDETPQSFEFDLYNGLSTQADLEALRQKLITTYDYDPGNFGNTKDELKSTKLFGKLSMNINEHHELSLRHQYTKGEQFNRNISSVSRINFSNNGIFFPTTTHSSALELNSRFRGNKSNNLILGYTSVRDDRDPLGNPFPYLIIRDGSGNSIRLGSEQFSTANQLDQDIFTITNNFKIFNGDHTFTIGTHNEFYSIYNLFIRQNFGVYEYNSLADFMNDEQANVYYRNYSLVDDIAGDGSAAAGDFNASQFGLYAQDEWTISGKLSLSYGLRLDIPLLSKSPAIDPSFNSQTLTLLKQKYEVAKSIQGGASPDGQLMFAPRIGFHYQFKDKRQMELRGGVGVFTSRIPFVWPGAMYTNNGLSIGNIYQIGGTDFVADVNEQYKNDNFSVPSGQVDLFVEDFKYPQVLRSNLALSTRLPAGIEANFEGLFTKTLNNVVYTNINSDSSIDFNWTGTPDNRPIYTNNTIDDTYSAIYAVSNTDEGYGVNLTASFAKNFGFGLKGSLAYTFGHAEAINEGTSSQNSSQWRGQINTDGRNHPVYGRSDFTTRHRIVSALTYTLDWNKKKSGATTISLFYNGQEGNPYSYIYGEGSQRAENINQETGSIKANTSLIWIPKDASEINLVDKGELSAAQQWTLLNAFIESDPYLSENRGGYAEKNAGFRPFVSILDLAIRQDAAFKIGGRRHLIQLSLDIFNFGNLINREWGTDYTLPGFNNYELIDFEGYAADGTTPLFSFTHTKTGKDNLNAVDSRWRMRFGIRYKLPKKPSKAKKEEKIRFY